MTRRRGDVEQVHSGRRCPSRGRISSLMVLVCSVLACMGAFAGVAQASAESCPNEEFRTGRSASLPDCRAYELVTPADLGRTQDLTFIGGEHALAAGSGEALALDSFVPLGPNPSSIGARAVFSRTAAGWEMKSVVPSDASQHEIEMKLFSPDLSQVALASETALNAVDRSPDITLEAGLIGGPYAPVASIPREDAGGGTELAGASADFSQVLFDSVDHALTLSSSLEETAAKETDDGALNLYGWSEGHLQLVNVRKDGSLVNPCGALLGAPTSSGVGSNETVNAVSRDGSTVFFTIPANYHANPSEPGCKVAENVYMRVNGGEPVEVSAPEPGVYPHKEQSARYNYATPDGIRVFFNTETALTRETPKEEEEEKIEEEEHGGRVRNKLFEYDLEEPEGDRLKRIAIDVPNQVGVGIGQGELQGFFFSENGEVVYELLNAGTVEEVYRDETDTGKRTLIATPFIPHSAAARSYVTPNGEYLLFGANLFEGSHEELFRYDHAGGSVMCVTCGAGAVPELGEELGGFEGVKTIFTDDDTPALAQITENGQEVFFETTARLVPRDTNSTSISGTDVYEWEAYGSGGCAASQGCTYLISAGETSGPSYFLGMSSDGRDVFFTSSTELVSDATPEFTNIYDARVDGGFPLPRPASKCLSCQGVGSPPPLFSPGASLTFAGAGNSVTSIVEGTSEPKCKRGYTRDKRGQCVKAEGRKKVHRRTSRKGGKRS
jgi:hypothetical protein